MQEIFTWQIAREWRLDLKKIFSSRVDAVCRYDVKDSSYQLAKTVMLFLELCRTGDRAYPAVTPINYLKSLGLLQGGLDDVSPATKFAFGAGSQTEFTSCVRQSLASGQDVWFWAKFIDTVNRVVLRSSDAQKDDPYPLLPKPNDCMYQKTFGTLNNYFLRAGKMHLQQLNETPGSGLPPGFTASEEQAMCCVSQSIVAASFLNNSAVAWMYSGENALAYQLLHTAVQGHNAVDERSTYAETAAATPRASDQMPNSSKNTSRPLPFVSCSLPKSRVDDKDSFIFFERPLIVDTTLALKKRSYDLVASAMLYNLALLHQQEGIKYGKSIYLKQADQFYSAASDAISATIREKTCTELEASLMLLAIWNNRAHIRYWYLVDFPAADYFIQKMKMLLQEHTAGVSMLMCDHRVFFLNALVHENGLVVTSSPAA